MSLQLLLFKKKRYGNNSIEVIYTFYILTSSNYLTLKAESHTLNYTNLWKERFTNCFYYFYTKLH